MSFEIILQKFLHFPKRIHEIIHIFGKYDNPIALIIKLAIAVVELAFALGQSQNKIVFAGFYIEVISSIPCYDGS